MNRSHFAVGGVRLAVAATGEGADFVFQHGLCGDAGADDGRRSGARRLADA